MNKQREKHHSPEAAGENTPAAHPAAEKPAAEEIRPGPDAATRKAAAEREPQILIESPEEKLEKAEREIADLKDQLLRLRADFENYRKRVLRDKVELYENANEALMLELLPVLDHFRLALKSAGAHHADRAFREGLQLIQNQLNEILAKHGLTAFNSEKQNFDPRLHEAVSSMPSETESEGLILAEIRPGYKFKNKLLRPAQVVVSSGKAPPPAKESPNNQAPNPK